MQRLPMPALLPKLWVVPPLLAFRRRRYKTSKRRRFGDGPEIIAVPADLRSIPGIRRRPEQEAQADAESPLSQWSRVHPGALDAILRHGWNYQLPVSPYRARAEHFTARVLEAARRTAAKSVTRGNQAAEEPTSPEALTQYVKSVARDVGLSAFGIARYDEKYTFAEYRAEQVGDIVLVGVLEAPWESTQTAPSALSEKGLIYASVEELRMMAEVGAALVTKGYRVRQGKSDHVVLHYAVEAGLGQLGMNGQLLTPFAGSRCRVATINTDAPLVPDAPVDFGIPVICDMCQNCARRCPAGAIPLQKQYYRGVEKWKVNSERCTPVIAKQNHCAVCIKVCPIQRYGLPAVIDHYKKTGEILGKGSSELDDYWFEGVLYSSGKRPRLSQEWLAEIPYNTPTAQHVTISERSPGV